MNVDIPLPNIHVTDVRSGGGKQLWDLWSQQQVVLCFARHLGCRFCQQVLKQLDSIKDDLEKCDPPVKLMVISLGSVEQGKEVLRLTKFRGELYVDTSTTGTTKGVDKQARSYQKFSLKRGKDAIFNENTIKYAKIAGDNGNTDRPMGSEEGSWPGDPLQVGGVFVLGPGNHCDFSFRSQFAGDHADLAQVMEAVTGKTDEGNDYIFPSTTKWFEKLKIAKRMEPLRIEKNSLLDASRLFGRDGITTLRTNIVFIYALGSIGVLIASMMSLHEITSFANVWKSNTFVLICLAFVYISWYMLCRERGVKKAKDIENTFDIGKIEILTTKEIDLRVVENGFAECECGSIINSISVDGEFVVEESHNVESSGDKKLESCDRSISANSTSSIDFSSLEGDAIADKPLVTRHRTQTWDSSLGLNEFQVMMCYIRNFLAKAHPCVGRKGPVCPFVPQSLRRNTLYMGIVRTGENTKREQIISCVSQYAAKFEDMEPKEGRLRKFKAIILIFPDVKESQTAELIDYVQLSCKSEFVKRGLMLGEFHGRNNSPGLRNKNFFPLRTPLPCLAIRHMVPTDIAFLDVESYDLTLRVSFLKSFLNVFGNEKHREVETAKAALEKILKK